MSRGWRWSLGLAAAVGTVVFAFALLSHNQDQRAIAAGPSGTNDPRALSMLRPQRVAAPGLQRSAAATGAGRNETAYSAATGGEMPESQAITTPVGPLANSSAAAAESSTPLSEGEEVVADSGESARRGNGTAGAGGSKANRSEKRAHESGRVTIANGAQENKDKDKPRADKSNVASVDKVAPQPAAARPEARQETRADARPESHLDSLELGLLPDVPIDEAVASPATEPAPAPMAAAPKAVLVSRVAHESDDESEARESAGPGHRASAEAPSESALPLANSAHVSITKIASRSGVSKSSVRGALNLTAITDCYRSAIRGGGVSGNRVVGELELATSQSGSVTEASLNAPELPTPLRHCVEQIVRRGRVKEADTGNAQATITLAFLPR